MESSFSFQTVQQSERFTFESENQQPNVKVSQSGKKLRKMEIFEQSTKITTLVQNNGLNYLNETYQETRTGSSSYDDLYYSNSFQSTTRVHAIDPNDQDDPTTSTIQSLFSRKVNRHEEFRQNGAEAPIYQYHSTLIQEISDRASAGLTEKDLELIRQYTEKDYRLLFEYTNFSTGETHLDHIAKHCDKTFLQPIILNIIMNISRLESNQIEKIKDLIFAKELDGDSLFQNFMTNENANVIFDCLLTTFNDVELNADPDKKTQILEYAYSMKRYDHIILHPKNLPQEIITKADDCYASNQVSMESVKEVLTQTNHPLYENWLSRRRSSSCTLAEGSSNQVRGCIERWNNANELTASYAKSDKENPNQWFDRGRLQKMHLRLCKGEEGVKSPGQFRDGIVRTSGGWTHMYCPQNFLEKNIEEFLRGFNRGLQQCEAKELNPIIFASQVYQQFVSLHPFENGNGRISRLLMDYVLERFDLPPPILGDDVLDAVFPLDQKRVDQVQFVEKIIEGIKHSKGLLDIK